MLSHLVIRFFEIPWTVALLAPLLMGISRQEYWSRLSFSPPGDLPKEGIEPTFPASLALAGGFLTIMASGKPPLITLAAKCRAAMRVPHLEHA